MVTINREQYLEAGLSTLTQPIRLADVVNLIAPAAGDYAAGDNVSNSTTDTLGVPLRVNNMARAPGGTAILQGVRAVCVATSGLVVAPIRLYWFQYAPTPAEVEMDDNVAFAIAGAAGGAKYVGDTLLNGFVDRGGISVSNTMGMQEALRCAPFDTGLFCVPTFETAETNESTNMSFRFDFYCF